MLLNICNLDQKPDVLQIGFTIFSHLFEGKIFKVLISLNYLGGRYYNADQI